MKRSLCNMGCDGAENMSYELSKMINLNSLTIELMLLYTIIKNFRKNNIGANGVKNMGAELSKLKNLT